MLAVAKKSEEDEMVNGDLEALENDTQINGEQDDKSSGVDIASPLHNENNFDHDENENENDVESNTKLNGGTQSEKWSSSSEVESDAVIASDTESDKTKCSPLRTLLSNETSSHDDGNTVKPVNCNLNGDTSTPNKNTGVNNCAKKVRPLKICFGVKNSINGVKTKNTEISHPDEAETDSRVHYIAQRACSDSDEAENEVQPEYAQYLGLQPSVKFKCSRCGTNNFNTMASLKEHMASCSGQTSLTALPMSTNTLSKGNKDANGATNLRITRKVFLCSSCGTYYQSYDLYIHMRELHNKQICLFCFNMFCRSQQLWDHLIAVHNLKLGEYSNVSQIRNAFKGSFYITCCTCNRIFNEDERFNEHVCQAESEAMGITVAPTQVRAQDTTHIRHNDVSNDSKKLPSSSDSEDSPSSPLTQVPPAALQNDADKEPVIDEIQASVEPSSEEHVSDVEPNKQEPVEDQQTVHYSPHEETLPSPANHMEIDLNKELPDNGDDIDTLEKAKDEDIAETMDQPDCQSVENNQDEPVPPNVEATAEAQPTDCNPIVNTYENGDSSDSEALDALFQRSVDEDAEEEKITQPLPMALMLDEAVASLSPQTLMTECVRTSCTSCTYCNNAILIAVNGKQLANHLLTEHRFKPTKNEDDSEQVSQKIESYRDELLEDVYMNASSNEFDSTFACFQCSFTTTLLRELCAHKRKAHQMNIFLCIVCKCNFFHYSELLCHECPGEYSGDRYSLRFRCCFCTRNHIPSAFRLMVHLRKFHKSCDFCLLRFNDQYELFSHMTKQHKMHHHCYKCNLAYRSRNDINKHLFWKHGTESVLCKKCLQKKWPHAYHFCMPAATYTCEECSRVFTKAVALTVHRRAHTGEFPFACECDQRFISKRLLAQHRRIVHSINDGKDEPLNTSNESSNQPSSQDAVGTAQRPEEGSDVDKKRRKKKRNKKEKMNEKPLLDELPPLNLSSESDDESGPEDEAPKEPQIPPASPPKPPSPVVEPPPPEQEVVEEKPPSPAPPLDEPLPENTPKDTLEDEQAQRELLEKALNCLLIEHSYCIPDAIFHSEPAPEGDAAQMKTPDAQNDASPHKHDASKSCCKSTTPHKRKRAKKTSSAGDSSSSASSSDSDSSSSSCGSNCSCNRSNSNCSSSSSGSDYSTTPEKKKSKSKQKKKEDQMDEKRTQEQREQIFLLDARESDLDTEISSAGEDFYEERPVPPPINDRKVEIIAESVNTTQPEQQIEKTSRSSRKDKKKKRKRIKLNLSGRIPPNCNPLKNTMIASSKPLIPTRPPLPVPNNEFVNQQTHPPHMQYMETIPHTYMRTDSIGSENCVNSDAAGDESGRSSKRKRVKNKFYGYSSSDDASRDSSSTKSVPKKRVLTKKNNAPKNRPFFGIRAKQLPPLPKRLSVTVPFTPVSGAQITEAYRPTPPPSHSNAYNPYNRFSTSEESDSDEKRHTLVINLPTAKQKMGNSFRPPYSDESMSSNSWVSSPRIERPIPTAVGPHLASQSGNFTNSPLKNSEKLYCYCQCPYDEVSEMIGCDAPNCEIEWFHFECVGIMVPPKGKWYCPSCLRNRENVSRFV